MPLAFQNGTMQGNTCSKLSMKTLESPLNVMLNIFKVNTYANDPNRRR